MNPEDLESQMLRMLDGDLSAEEAAVLEQKLIEDPGARETWRQLSRIHSTLEIRFAAHQTISESAPVPMSRVLEEQRRKVIRISVFAAAAAVVIVAAVLWMIATPGPVPRLASFKTAQGSTFTLTHTDTDKSPAGNSLSQGSTLVIDHGVAEILLPYDVRAVVEGPASLTMQDDRTLKMDKGHGLFEITSEKGKGFTVMTPHQRIVDLGTSFGIEVRPGSDLVDIHVFDGKVRVDTLAGNEGEVLQAPRSVQLDKNRAIRAIARKNFLSELPDRLVTIFEEDFESGLVPGREYSVRTDRAIVTNDAGRPFKGIPDKQPWVFQSLDHAPDSIVVTNPGFEEGQQILRNGQAIPGWHPASIHWGWGTQKEMGSFLPTEGGFFGRVFRGHWLTQKLSEPIVAGTTYILTLDCGLVAGKSSAEIRLWGSDKGPDAPIASKVLTGATNSWMKDEHLVFTATEKDATGQTLGISLGCLSDYAAFDRVRIGTLEDVAKDDPLKVLPPSAENFQQAPRMTSRYPGKSLRLAFDQPIRSGKGRVIIHDRDKDVETVLVAGSPLLQIDGQVLTFLPQLSLEDGEVSMGQLGGWQTQAWAGVINPSGIGNFYEDSRLNDQSDSEGSLPPMRGPHLATMRANPEGKGIRREIGKISADTRYMITAAIGVRSAKADPRAEFAGYTLRLRSGGIILSEISSSAPPCAPNGFASVGFSWDSSSFPAGVSVGDPLTLEIAPMAGNHGYLDIDAVRVTKTGPAF